MTHPQNTRDLLPSSTIFTIGHSNHEPMTFLDLLKKYNIQILVDIRSSPYSRYATQYNKDTLEFLVSQANIEYQYFGAHLGGKPSGPQFYDSEDRVLYGKIAESESFLEGIERLLELVRFSTVAILCSEEDPSQCHRRLLVTRVLVERGIGVLHIRGDGSVIGEEELQAAEEAAKTKGQLSMFASAEDEAWKSTRSVSHKNPPRNSSESSKKPV